MKNAFGAEIWEIKELLEEEKIEKSIKAILSEVLSYLGIAPIKSNKIMDSILDLAHEYRDLSKYETKVHALLEKEGVKKAISSKLVERATLIFNQIIPFVHGNSILDLGCGDGQVGYLLSKKGKEVTLSDVYKHNKIDNLGLNFIRFDQDSQIPFNSKMFDTILVLTVFHHSDNPLKLLQEAIRLTKQKGRIIVIESVFAVNGKELSEHERNRISSYLVLSSEKQRKVNIFFDHFYNRIVHYSSNPKTKVNVPYNFNTPEKWKSLFESNGAKQIEIIHLGVDQPAVPEYHTLHILEVQ